MSKIRDLRLAAGMTQVQLAEAARTDQRMISRIEVGSNGADGTSLAVAARIAAALGVHAEELLDVRSSVVR